MTEYKSRPWYALSHDPEIVGQDLSDLMDGGEDLAPTQIEECRVVRKFWAVQTYNEEDGTDYHEFDTREEAENFCEQQREKIEALAT